MRRRDFLATSMAALVTPWTVGSGQGQAAQAQSARSTFPTPGADGWSPLFNGKNLDGWYTFLSRSGKNADPTGCIRVDEGMIHILGIPVTKENPEAGYMATIEEYSDYHLRVDFKWGSTRFPPRALAKRDSGLYFHLVEPDRVWPTGMQLQIQETNLGDILPVNGVRYITSNAAAGTPPWPNPPGANAVQAGAAGQPRGWQHAGNFERLDDWNTLEIITRDDKAAFLVNGRIINSMFAMQVSNPAPPPGKPGVASQQQPAEGAAFVPLRRGRIALEVEYAEIWFRNIEIRPLAPGEFVTVAK